MLGTRRYNKTFGNKAGGLAAKELDWNEGDLEFNPGLACFPYTSSKSLGHQSESQVADKTFHKCLGALGTNI